MVVFLLKERKIVFLCSLLFSFFFFFFKLLFLEHFSAPQEDVCIASAHQFPFAPTSISSFLFAERGVALLFHVSHTVIIISGE